MGEDDARAAFRCASELLDRRRLQGVPLPAWLVSHYHRMQTLAARGKESDGAAAQLEYANALDTEAVAAMLNKSPRWVRLHAAKLGGQKVGNRNWVFEPGAVREQLEGQQRD